MRKHGLTLKFKRSKVFRAWLKKLMVVPLLPAELITEAFNQLLSVRFPGFSATDRGNFNRFCAYVNRQWVPMDPSILSVHGLDDTTNNGLESHHSYLKSEIKVAHPGAWTFVGKLNDIIDDKVMDRRRLLNDPDNDIVRGRRQVTLLAIERRRSAEQRLASGEFNITRFLDFLSHSFDSNINRLLGEQAIDQGNFQYIRFT